MPNNNLFTPENDFRYSFLFPIFLLLLTAFLTCFSISVRGQIGIPVTDLFKDIEGKTTEIKGLGDRLFIGTNVGLWLVGNDGEPVRQKEVIGGITNIRKFADQIFVVTNSGLWYTSENSGLVQVMGINGIINNGSLGDQLFVGTNDGLWIVGNSNKTSHYKEIKGRINHIEVFGEQLFVNTDTNSWLVRKNRQPTQINGIESKINRVKPFGGQLFINTGNGSWIIDINGNPSKVNEVIEGIYDLISFGEQLFIGAEKQSWTINKEGKINPVKEFNERIGNSGIFGNNLFVNAGGNSWIIAEDGLLSPVEKIKGRVSFTWTFKERLFVCADNSFWIIGQNNQPVQISEIKSRINSINPFGERLFVNTENGSWIMDKDNKLLSEVSEIKERVKPFAIFGEQLFIGTDKNLWVTNKDGENPRKIESITGNIENITIASKYIYVKVSDTFSETFYRVEPNVKIAMRLIPADSWITSPIGFVVSWFWSNPLPAEKTPIKASYSDENNKDPYGENIPKEFRFALAAGSELVSDDKFSPQEQFGYPLSLFRNKAHYWVKDKWGNAFEQREQYFGYPGAWLAGILILISPIVFILTCFLLAPRYKLCNSAIMNSWWRNFLSLGTNSGILLQLTPIRNRILRRHSRGICKSDDFKDFEKEFEYQDADFQPENFRKKMESEKRLLIVGASDPGTKTLFLKHLAASYAFKSKEWFSEKTFPIYVSLADYDGNSFEGLIYEQLVHFGEISPEFAPIFLERGKLLIFLDGADNINTEQGRKRLVRFVEKYGKKNCLCLSLQQYHSEFDKITPVALTTFSRKSV
jgi:hypothetical protein